MSRKHLIFQGIFAIILATGGTIAIYDAVGGEVVLGVWLMIWANNLPSDIK